MGGHVMITVPNTVIKQISSLSEEQYVILTSLLNEFTNANSLKANKRNCVGIAKHISVPSDFDDMDYGTSELFGLNQ